MTVADDSTLYALARDLGAQLLAHGATVATAESCTGGWIGKVLTDVPGSSAWFGWGVISYANTAKTAMLGVPRALLERHGAVSREVVEAMVSGALAASGAQHALAVSGVAGPDGGTPEKPVGTVWFAWQERGEAAPRSECRQLAGDRDAVRRETVRHALAQLLGRLDAPARAD